MPFYLAGTVFLEKSMLESVMQEVTGRSRWDAGCD
jgi:hypothetical protein